MKATTVLYWGNTIRRNVFHVNMTVIRNTVPKLRLFICLNFHKYFCCFSKRVSILIVLYKYAIDWNLNKQPLKRKKQMLIWIKRNTS